MKINKFFFLFFLQERERRESQILELQRKNDEERERLKKEDEERQKHSFRLAQQQQLAELQKKREEAYKEFLREKLMMDIVAQELMEDEKQYVRVFDF